MFNLVQIQERLKDMPMQALMAYANGQSQEVPPFLALGELNRRKRMQQGAQAEQAKQMEGAPTVKEQLEQQAGLMALQGARQRQAASRQQGLQALTPGAAPNTTTSEPAQLASGGAVNDVIGRDFQRGGQVSPDMLKKLMMLKKMKQMQQARGGLGGLMGKDYAGGGIVAFAQGSKDPIGKSPAEETEEDRRRKASMMAVRPGNEADKKEDFFDRLFGDNKRPMPIKVREKPEDISPEELKSNREMGLIDALKATYGPVIDKIANVFSEGNTLRQDIQSGISNTPGYSQAEVRRGDVSEMAPVGMPGEPGIARAPSASPAVKTPAASQQPKGAGIASIPVGMKAPKDLTDEEQFARIKRLQQMAGVQANPYADYEKRLAEIEARRKGQEMTPMDKLTEFLGAIATSKRGGNWATQGAEASQTIQKAEEGRRQLQDKQDMDMAALRMSMAKERDARARGDATAVMAEQEKQAKLKQDIAEAQSLDRYRRESIGVQRERLTADNKAEEQRKRIAMVDNYIKSWMQANKGATKYITNPGALEQDAVAAAVARYGKPFLQSLGETGVAMLSPDMGTGKVIDFSSIK